MEVKIGDTLLVIKGTEPESMTVVKIWQEGQTILFRLRGDEDSTIFSQSGLKSSMEKAASYKELQTAKI